MPYQCYLGDYLAVLVVAQIDLRRAVTANCHYVVVHTQLHTAHLPTTEASPQLPQQNTIRCPLHHHLSIPSHSHVQLVEVVKLDEGDGPLVAAFEEGFPLATLG